jgi:hypothetical protein
MNALSLLPVLVLAAAPVSFERHAIDTYPAGYQVAVADVNGDGRPDVIALATDANRLDWYENPSWKRRPVATLDKPIDLAVRDLDGDGRPEIAVAYGFYFADSQRGGQIAWLSSAGNLDEPWRVHPIATDPVVHRLRWADLDGDGQAELVHAPIFGPGSNANVAPRPSHLWAFRPPQDLADGRWEVLKIDESLTVLHGLSVVPAAKGTKPPRDALIAASFEGIVRFDPRDASGGLRWKKTQIASGARPADAKPGTPRGSSEVVRARIGQTECWAAIEPWHGNQVVVYLPERDGYRRVLLDDSLSEGHALVAADFDGDGDDEIVAGWRGAGGGLVLFDPIPSKPGTFRRIPLDRDIAIEGAIAVDLNGDGRLDLVAIAGRSNRLVWYENR